jgi:signal transduction histidine kinase
MPEIDGFQVLKHMKADDTLRHLPVIVISALDEMGAVVRSIQMGATDHLIKPCDPFLLRARVNASLAAKRLRDQETAYLRHVDQLTRAAADLEAGTFAPECLAPVAARTDALGQLARVFQHMAHEVFAREQHLQHQNEFKTALIGKVTHELRSPFVAAGFSVQVLQRYAERNMVSEMHEQIRALDGQLAEGRKMLDNVIAFASLVGKQAELHVEETNLALLAQNVTLPLKQLAEGRGVLMSYDMALPLASVRVDRKQLGDAIQHLVHNAIKFNREHGAVRISCQSDENELVFTVEDTGIGIAPDKLSAIWEAFTQTSDDVQRGVEGLGLGLALVRYVVEAHHGAAFARSTLGQGSVFGFRLPISK